MEQGTISNHIRPLFAFLQDKSTQIGSEKSADDKPKAPDSVNLVVENLCRICRFRPGFGALKLDLLAVSFAAQQNFGVGSMVSFSMSGLVHWFAANGNALAVVVTVGVAVLLICCLWCADCPRREKDDLFRRHEL